MMENKPIPEETTPQKNNLFTRELGFLLLKIIGIIAAFLILFTFLYGLHRSQDNAMSPAIEDGDLTVFYRLNKQYKINDIIVLNFENANQLRRVVATTGDTVDITEDGLIINNALQQELNIYEPTHRYDNNIVFPITVGENQVFVLADARENATDSRVYGLVNKNQTMGKIITLIRYRNF